MRLFIRICSLVSLFLFLELSSKAQLAFSPLVESVTATVNNEQILLHLRELSGDTTAIVNGQLTTISSRHYLSPGNALAAQYIFQKFTEYGYQPEYQYFTGNRGVNVIATKPGNRFPDKEYVVCAHYDNLPTGQNAPGADDNASGITAILEAARVLNTLNPEYTVRFAAWDEEEIGYAGSSYYVQQAFTNGNDIIGALNIDMIAWDSNDDMLFSIAKNANSEVVANDFITTTGYYQPELKHNFISSSSSDHASFWQHGYPAIMAVENFFDFNAHYHTTGDDISAINTGYFSKMVKAVVANVISVALNQRIEIIHNPIISGNSTQPREASFIINSQQPIDNSVYNPRLFYSTDGISFNFITPSETIENNIKFMIPGFPVGTVVNYYFALQDEYATMVATLPEGGKGISPPGTTPPLTYFAYQVDNIELNDNCSANTPLPIVDNSNTYDQINISQKGFLLDLDVMVDITHPRTTELRLILISPDNIPVTLSDRNGNEGDNYTQTIFDDQAVNSIKQGVAPFTGRFMPEFPLSTYKDKSITGQWQLRIAESGNTNSGILNQWCLHFLFKDQIIGTGYEPYKETIRLLQNFPNPANDQTSIKFSLPKSMNVTLTLYDNLGNEIQSLVSGYQQAGDHLIVTSVVNLLPGIYFYTLRSDTFVITKKMIIIK